MKNKPLFQSLIKKKMKKNLGKLKLSNLQNPKFDVEGGVYCILVPSCNNVALPYFTL